MSSKSPQKLVSIIVWDPNVVQDKVIDAVLAVEEYFNQRCGFVVDKTHEHNRLVFIKAVTNSVNTFYLETDQRPHFQFEDVHFLFDNRVTPDTYNNNSPTLYIWGVPLEAVGLIQGAGVMAWADEYGLITITFSLDASHYQINIGEVEVFNTSSIEQDFQRLMC